MSNIYIMISRSKKRFLITFVAPGFFYPQASNIKVLKSLKSPSFKLCVLNLTFLAIYRQLFLKTSFADLNIEKHHKSQRYRLYSLI